MNNEYLPTGWDLRRNDRNYLQCQYSGPITKIHSPDTADETPIDLTLPSICQMIRTSLRLVVLAHKKSATIYGEIDPEMIKALEENGLRITIIANATKNASWKWTQKHFI